MYILRLNGQIVNQVWVVGEHDYSPKYPDYVKMKSLSSSSNPVKFYKNGSSTATVMYSTDNGATWASVTSSNSNTPFVTLQANQEVLFKHGSGANPSGISTGTSKDNAIISTYGVELSGDLRTLVYGDDSPYYSSVPDYAFYDLFKSCNVMYADDLYCGDKRGTLTAGSFSFAGLFSGCSLLQAPMFINNIETAAESTFNSMHYSCSALSSTPAMSAIKTVGQECMSGMFRGCTSLTAAADLSGISTVGLDCFKSMYYGCTSLTTASDISGITSSTRICPQMYYSCSSLSQAYAPNNSRWYLDSSLFQNWLYGVAASGSFYYDTSFYTPDEIPSGASGCPSGWTKRSI